MAKPTTIELVDITMKGAALLIGAAWTLLVYLRGRTFTRRFELSVLGTLNKTLDKRWISGIARVKNVGLTKVPIEQEGSAIEILFQRIYPDGNLVGDPEPSITLSAFAHHRWVEPGETIEQSFSAALPADTDLAAAVLTLRIISKGSWFSKNIEWNADSISSLSPDKL